MPLRAFDAMQPLDAYYKGQERQRMQGVQEHQKQRQTEMERRGDVEYQRAEEERPRLQQLASRKQKIEEDAELGKFAKESITMINPESENFDAEVEKYMVNFTNKMQSLNYTPEQISSQAEKMFKGGVFKPDNVRLMQEKAGLRRPAEKADTSEWLRRRKLADEEASKIRVAQRARGVQSSEGGGEEYVTGSPQEQVFKGKIAGDFGAVKALQADVDLSTSRFGKLFGTPKKNAAGDTVGWEGENASLDAITGKIDDVMPTFLAGSIEAENMVNEFKSTAMSAGKAKVAEGGAVGAISEKEWPIFAGMVSNIDPAAGKDALRRQMKAVIDFQEGISTRASSKYKAQYGDKTKQYPEFQVAEGSSSGIDSLLNKYK